jgi:hypothetical protein
MNLARWSPFQSSQVREICAHLSRAEKQCLVRHGFVYGLWVAATVGLPISIALQAEHVVAWGIAAGLLLVHLVALPMWQARVRRMLCSTEWARSQGVTPENLGLFGRRL